MGWDTDQDLRSARSVFYMRFLHVLVFLAYLALAGRVAPGMLSLPMVLGGLGLYSAFMLILFFLAARGGLRPPLLLLAMSLDLAMIGLAFCHDPISSMPSLIPVIMVLLGNGLRHGMGFYYLGLLQVVLTIAISILIRQRVSPAGIAEEAWLTIAFVLLTCSYGAILLSRFRRHRETLELHSRFDEVTGLFSRRHIRDVADKRLAQCRRQEQSCLLLYLDMDNFKQINDLHGHAQGDEALLATADMLRQALPLDAELGRHGGDEFIVVLAGHSAQSAESLRAKLKHQIQAVARRWPQVNLGISLGAASAPEDGVQLDDLLRVADQRMYAQKNRDADAPGAILAQA